ncbi:hypothetical protein MCEL_00130 [Mycolicibacterium celeriflavum]|uniref:Rieske domain-containing protein n=1 Tax=Mycolicibacterium celeriflavum TaxID=1249101 RepID=A0A7I7RB04_MYCCF|nr:hypothetical protein MCEL_00130 [Mycolicibacterium celeriflavum]
MFWPRPGAHRRRRQRARRRGDGPRPEYIYCPWHQWGFELATGTTAVKPEWSVRTYPVRVVGNEVLVQA